MGLGDPGWREPDRQSTAPIAGLRRRLVRGSSVYGLSTFGLRALGFFLLGIYSRYFSPRDYGIVSLAESIGAVVTIVAGLPAIENGARRLYFQFAGDAGRLRSYLGTALRFAGAASAIALLLAYVLGPAITSRLAPHWDAGFFPYLALPIFTALASQLFQCRLMIYQCQERLAAYTAFAILHSLATTIFTFGLVVWTRHGALGLLAARSLGAGLALLAVVGVSGPLLRAKPNWADVRETLQISLPLIPHGLTALGLVVLDRFILQHYRPLSEVGLYALAYNAGMVMTMVTSSLSRAWTPLFFSMLRTGDEGRRAAGGIFDELIVLLMLVASAGALLAPLGVRWLFNSHYWPAAGVAPIVLGAYLCHSLFMLFQTSVMQARRTLLIGVVSGIALLVNVGLNLAWVPKHGMVGAAYATLGAYFVELVLIAVVAHRVLPLPHRWLWPLIGGLTFAVALAWTQLQTAVIPTLIFSGLLIAASAAGFIHFLRKKARAPLPEEDSAAKIGLETF